MKNEKNARRAALLSSFMRRAASVHFSLIGALLAAVMGTAAATARADAVDALREFTRDAKTGRAVFTQVVTSPDGVKKKTSSGSFEFARPNRFRFAYTKPYEQTIVGDGQKLWLHDPDLQQVTVRAMDKALGATPAALLAGGQIERDFELKALPSAQGLDWVQALPKTKDENLGYTSLRVGFKGKALAALELTDSFGQKSTISFNDLVLNTPVNEQALKFTPPAGTDVLTQ
jgi:outer membrane lipoprotein carrier protein